MRAILDSGPLIALWNAEPDHLFWVEEVSNVLPDLIMLPSRC